MTNKFINSRRHRRNMKINDNIRDFFNNKENEQVALNEEIQAHASMEKDKMYNRMSNINAKQREKRLVNDHIKQLNEMNALSIYPNLFGAVVYQSLKLDPQSKLNNADKIFDKATEVFTEAVKEGHIEASNSPIFSDVFEYAKDSVQGIEKKLSDEESKKIISKVYKDNQIKLDYLSNAVADKVTKAIKDEKELAKIKKSLKENDSYVKEESSLLRMLHESNINMMINGTEELTESLIMNEDNKDNISQEAFINAVVDYTIIELLHTSKLKEFNYDKFYKSVDIYKADIDDFINKLRSDETFHPENVE